MSEKFAMLYDTMATSKNPENMKVFGGVMSEMMAWAIQNKPDMAEEWIEALCAIKWKNYLTSKEAAKIVAEMNPKAPWSWQAWTDAMGSFGLIMEEMPYYNRCSMWAVMNMIYSDSAQTIAKLMGKPLAEVSDEEMVSAVHSLATDKLTDADGRFNVRTYFGL